MGNCCTKGPKKTGNQNVGELEVQHFLDATAMSPPTIVIANLAEPEATVSQLKTKTEESVSGSAIGLEPEISAIETSKLDKESYDRQVPKPLNEVSAAHIANPIVATSGDAEVRVSYAAMLLRDSKPVPPNVHTKTPVSPARVHHSTTKAPVLPLVKANVPTSPVSQQQKVLSHIASPVSSNAGNTRSSTVRNNGISATSSVILSKPPQIKVIQPSKEQHVSEATLVKSPSKSVKSPSKHLKSPEKNANSSFTNLKSPAKSSKAENYVNENQQIDRDGIKEEKKPSNNESKRRKKKKKSRAETRKSAHAI